MTPELHVGLGVASCMVGLKAKFATGTRSAEPVRQTAARTHRQRLPALRSSDFSQTF